MDRLKQKSTQAGIALIAYGLLAAFTNNAPLQDAVQSIAYGLGLVVVDA